MNKLSQILTVAFIICAGFFAKAQKADEPYFIGTWKLMVFGLPNGDTPMVLNIQKVDGQLTGTIGEGKSTDNKLTKATIDSKGVFNANFIGGGYNVPIYLEKKDDKTVEGSMNDMFDITGTKEEK